MRLSIKLPRMRISSCSIESILYVMFIAVEIGTFILRSSFLLRNIGLTIIGALCIFYCLVKNGTRINRPFINFIAFYTLCGIMSMIVNQNADLQELLWPSAYMGVGLLLLNFKMPFQTAKWTYITVSIVFVVVIFIAGGADNLRMLSSRNTISVYELQLWAVYMISAYQNKEDAKYWSILLGLFVSVISIGRGGIITFAIMLLLFIFFRFKKGESKRTGLGRFVLYLVLLIVLGIIVYRTYGFYINQMISNFKLRGVSSKRLLIWKEYIEATKSSILYCLFGAPQRGSFWMDAYADNLHNSFFELHAKYGLFMFAYIIIILSKRAISFFRRKEIYLFIPLIGMIIRMNADYTNFNSMLDMILIYLLLKPRYEKQMNERVVFNEYYVL